MTLHLDDARWRAAVDAELRGEATPEQSALAAEHAPQSDEHRAEAAFLAALADPPTEAQDADPAWLKSAVDAYAETQRPEPSEAHRPRPWVWVAAAIVVSIGAASLALRNPQTPQHAEPSLVAHRSPALEAADAPPHDDSSWQIASGSARLTAALPIDQTITVETRLCAERAGHSICADAGARVTARGSGALALHAGKATVRSQEDDDVRVELDAVTVHAAAHSVVSIDRQVASWSVTVERGAATVTELGSSRRLEAGERLQRGPTTADTSRPQPTAEAKPKVAATTLLGRARAQRRDGNTSAAMKTYAALIRQHPRSPVAQTARMSLAQLHLDRGAAKDALRLFRSYTKRGGPLAEDAAYGEIRALRKLGRSAEAGRAADAFVKRYPSSPYGAKLKP